ncbi:MAG: hypothetical protein JWL83_4480 [Actinomycetia bacterium]|nr:hypothetical protein [Actinomycetes bacterium]
MGGFAQSHLGVVPRSHLLDLTVTPRQIQHLLALERLDRRFKAVYQVVGTPECWEQQQLSACWAGGVRSYSSHRAAAELWGLPGGEKILEITSPRWRRARHTGVIVHESRVPESIDVTVVNGAIPVTRPARTILDLCTLAARGLIPMATVELALQEAVRRDLVDIALIGVRWEQLGRENRMGGTAAKRLIDRWLPDAADVDSRPENKLLRLLSDAGLPNPTPQHRVWLKEGDYVEIDFAWPDQRVALEFDSYRWHGGRMKHDADNRRGLRLRERAWDVVPVTDQELDAGCPHALPVLVRLLESVRR